MVLAGLGFTVSAVHAASPVWTAETAAERALHQPAAHEALEAALRRIDADSEAATTMPSPVLNVGYEHTFGPAAVRGLEFQIGASQTFDLVDWRGAMRDMAPHQQAAARAEIERWHEIHAYKAMEAFYAVRALQEDGQALTQWVARLDAAVVAVQARVAAGDASQYEGRRVGQELARAQMIEVTIGAQEEAAWAELRRRAPFEGEERPILSGALIPERPVDIGDEGDTPEMAHLAAQARVVAAEIDVWGSPALRGWEAGAAYRLTTTNGAVGHGFMLTLSVPLAFWSPDDARVEALRAEQTRLGFAQELALSRQAGALRAVRARVDAALDGLTTLEPSGARPPLAELAEAAFAAGEASLLEVLDAYTSDVELMRARIALEQEARSAALEFAQIRALGVAH